MTVNAATSRHESRVSASIRALTSLVTAAVAVVGVPWGLWHYVGWPLPHTLPSINEIRLAIELRDFSDRLLIGTLAMVVWIAWAMVQVSRPPVR